MMNVTVNGEIRELSGEAPTVRDMVEQLGFGSGPLAVEVNRKVVPKRHHDETALHDGDVIEVVTLVGGG